MQPVFEFYFGCAVDQNHLGWNWALWDSLWVNESKPPLLCGFETTQNKALAQVKDLVGSPYLRQVATQRAIESFVAHQSQINLYTQSYFNQELWPAQPNPFEPQQFGFIQQSTQPVWSIAPQPNGGWAGYVWSDLKQALSARQPTHSQVFNQQTDGFLWCFESCGSRTGQGLDPEFAAQTSAKIEADKRDKERGLPLSESDFLYANQAPGYIKAQQQWTAHRVVQKSKTSLTVLQRPFPCIEVLNPRSQQRIGEVYQVDRIKLERQGHVYSRSAGLTFRSTVFPLPEPQMPTNLKKALQLLAFGPEVQATNLKQRYRELALRVHPDKGGTSQGFRRLQSAVSLIDQYIKQRDK